MCDLLRNVNDTFKNNLIIMNSFGINWKIIRSKSILLSSILPSLIVLKKSIAPHESTIFFLFSD